MFIHIRIMTRWTDRQAEAMQGERRGQILDAAMECFARRGFHQTTMQDMSREAGISVGLIYRYFESKEAVIEAMAGRHQGVIAEMLAEAARADSLDGALRIFFSMDGEDGGGCPPSRYVVELFAEAGRNPHVARCVSDVMESIRGALTELLDRHRDGIAAGHLDTVDLADLLLTMKHGMHMGAVLDGMDGTGRPFETTPFGRLWRMLIHEPPARPSAHAPHPMERGRE